MNNNNTASTEHCPATAEGQEQKYLCKYDHEFYPTDKNRSAILAHIDHWDSINSNVPSMSHLDRRKLLQQHFPSAFVDAFTPISSTAATSTTTIEISHDELIEALQETPHLVLEETPVERFLFHLCGSTTSKDPEVMKEAATKIAMYWKLRKYFFQDRAFLPMAQTDRENNFEGALSDEDMKWYNRNFLFELKNPDPSIKKAVSVLDVTRLPSHHKSEQFSENIKLRLCFYQLHLALIMGIQSFEFVSVIAEQTSQYFSMWGIFFLRAVFPIRYDCFHVLFLPSKIMQSSLLTFAVAAAKLILSQLNSLTVVKFHMGYNDESVLRKFASSIGVNRADIPWNKDTNSWDCDYPQWWRKENRILEQRKWAGRNMGMPTQSSDGKKRTKESERKRSKQRRMSERNQVHHLKKQIRELEEQQKDQKEENARLENLLEYATAEICVLHGLDEAKNAVFDPII